MSYWRLLHMILVSGVMIFSPSYAGQMESRALIELAKMWVSQQQGLEPDQIHITPPDHRVIIKECSNDVQFDYPFKNNQRTIIARCHEPTWQFYLAIRFETGEPVVVATRRIPKNSVISESDVTLQMQSRSTEQMFTTIESVIGKLTHNDLNKSEILTTDDLTNPMRIFVANKAYQPNDVIDVSTLKESISPRANSQKPLGVPESGYFIATSPIRVGDTLVQSNVTEAQVAVLASKTLPIGKILSHDDLQTQLIMRNPLAPEPIPNLSDAIGMELLRSVRTNEAILKADLQIANLVNKGEIVTLVVEKGALKITSQLKALEDGRLGESIQLINEESGKRLEATIFARGRVKLK
jgi:flagella basal body P-ring formation protein FlgA